MPVMKPPRGQRLHLRADLLLALLLIWLLSFSFSSQSAETVAEVPESYILRCRWMGPDNGTEVEFDYAQPPVLLVKPGAEVRCHLYRAGQAVTLKAIVELDEGFAIITRNKLPPDATGVEFAAPNTPGPVRLALVFSEEGQLRQFPFALLVPREAKLTGRHGLTLKVDDTVVGRYGNAASSRSRMVYRMRSHYRPPRYFSEIAEGLEGFLVTPRLRLEHMVIPSEDTGKRHTRLFPCSMRFLSQAEKLFAALAEAGMSPADIRILSMFRSPPYNRRIGSSTFSRHVYGDAFDMYFDGDSDGVADDLTGDGRVDVDDALKVINAIEKAQHEGRLSPGGIGVYYFPYVTRQHRLTFHIDFRRHRATWAQEYDRRGRPREWEWQSRYFAAEDEARKKFLKGK